MAEAKRTGKRPRSAAALGDPAKRHPGNLAKQLMDACNRYGEGENHRRIGGGTRLTLLGLLGYSDPNGWSFPGNETLARFSGATEKTVARGLSELMGAGIVACIEAGERRGKALPWKRAGSPLNKPSPTAKLYLLKPIATKEALTWLDNAQQAIGRAPPENPVSSRWAIVSKGEREPFHLGKDIIEMVARRELDGSALVRASSMRDPIAVRDVLAFASAIPGPLRYALDNIAAKVFSEEELAGMVLGGGLKADPLREVWPDDGSDRVKLLDLPRVVAALTERRVRVTRHENDDVRAAG